MTKLHIWPALRYQLDYIGKTTLWIVGISFAILLITSLFLSTMAYGAEVTVPIIGVLATIIQFNIAGVLLFMAFLFGVGGIREDFKFYLQHGMGRKTTFLSTVLIGLISGFGWGLLSQILTALSANWPAFPASGMLFPTGNFLLGWMLHMFLFFLFWQFGALCSLIYYRMNKIQKVIFSAAAIALVVFIIPNAIGSLVNFFIAPADIAQVGTTVANFLGNPVNHILIYIIPGAICTLINFLLIRRAQARD